MRPGHELKGPSDPGGVDVVHLDIESEVVLRRSVRGWVLTTFQPLREGVAPRAFPLEPQLPLLPVHLVTSEHPVLQRVRPADDPLGSPLRSPHLPPRVPGDDEVRVRAGLQAELHAHSRGAGPIFLYDSHEGLPSVLRVQHGAVCTEVVLFVQALQRGSVPLELHGERVAQPWLIPPIRLVEECPRWPSSRHGSVVAPGRRARRSARCYTRRWGLQLPVESLSLCEERALRRSRLVASALQAACRTRTLVLAGPGLLQGTCLLWVHRLQPVVRQAVVLREADVAAVCMRLPPLPLRACVVGRPRRPFEVVGTGQMWGVRPLLAEVAGVPSSLTSIAWCPGNPWDAVDIAPQVQGPTRRAVVAQLGPAGPISFRMGRYILHGYVRHLQVVQRRAPDAQR